MRTSSFPLWLVALAASAVGAQAPARTVNPGMSQAEVVAALGTPIGVRTSAGHTYLFYANGCERTCGMSDVVTLDDGRVVDAVFRSPTRHYSGESSSPHATRPSAAAATAARTEASAAVLRVEPAAPSARAARPARRAPRGTRARSAVTITGANGAPAPAEPEQTRALIVAPRRQPVSVDPRPGTVFGDSTVQRAGLADTATSSGTRFGSPATTAPGPATPQAPGIGAPPSRDSSVRNGVALPPGSVPVPFQGARPAATDSARIVNERQRAQQSGGAAPAQRPPR